MTAPLFTDRDPCGCERALGHVCCPPWMDENEWPMNSRLAAKLHECDYDGDSNKTAPAGNRGLTSITDYAAREAGIIISTEIKPGDLIEGR